MTKYHFRFHYTGQDKDGNLCYVQEIREGDKVKFFPVLKLKPVNLTLQDFKLLKVTIETD